MPGRPPVVAFLLEPWTGPFGGTERYTSQLMDHIRQAGWTVAPLAVAPEERVQPERLAKRLAGLGAALACVHVWSARAARAAVIASQQAGLPSLITWHVSALACANETLMAFTGRLCRGRATARACAACVVGSRLPEGFRALGPIVAAVGRHAPPRLVRRLKGRLRTACELARSVPLRTVHSLDWLHRVSHFHVFSRHSRRTLLANGVPPDRLTLIPHGVEVRPVPPVPRQAGDPVRFGFAGRTHPAKGLSVLLRAIERLDPRVKAEFRLYGLHGTDGRDWTWVRRLADKDYRTKLCAPFSADELPRVLAGLDVMIVPSTGVETGPLTALEALAGGVPVIGSDLPAINEQVRDGRGGLLFPAGDAAALADRIARVAGQPGLLEVLRRSVPRVPTMAEHTRQVLALYRRLIGPAQSYVPKAG